jgi:hypothetical protein
MNRPSLARSQGAFVHRRVSAYLFAFLCVVAQGCSTAAVQLTPAPASANFQPADSGDALTILFTADFSLDAVPVEAGAVESCISAAVSDRQPQLRIVPAAEFVRVAFADLPPGGAPTDIKYLSAVLPHPLFRQRIAPLNLRYLIVVSGGTEAERSGGSFSGAAPRAFVIIGGYVWDRKSSFRATIVDLHSTQPAAQAESVSAGRAWLFFIMPSPIILGAPAFTESRACAELGSAIASFLAGAARPDVQEVTP